MATTSYDAGYTAADEYDVRGGGWITFAAVMLGLSGTFAVLEGILAIANSRVYTGHQTLVFSNLNTWGWIVLLLGVGMLLAAFGLFSGSELARWFGVFVASINAIGQLFYIAAYPFWGLTMFTIDLLVIYGLVAYAGHKMRRDA